MDQTEVAMRGGDYLQQRALVLGAAWDVPEGAFDDAPMAPFYPRHRARFEVSPFEYELIHFMFGFGVAWLAALPWLPV